MHLEAYSRLIPMMMRRIAEVGEMSMEAEDAENVRQWFCR